MSDVLATVGVPPTTRMAPPLTRSVPAASWLTVMLLFRASPKMLSAPPGRKEAVTAGAMRSDSPSRAGAGRPELAFMFLVWKAGPDFHFSKRCNQDSAMRRALEERNKQRQAPPTWRRGTTMRGRPGPCGRSAFDCKADGLVDFRRAPRP